jgi:hypothetical protein
MQPLSLSLSQVVRCSPRAAAGTLGWSLPLSPATASLPVRRPSTLARDDDPALFACPPAATLAQPDGARLRYPRRRPSTRLLLLWSIAPLPSMSAAPLPTSFDPLSTLALVCYSALYLAICHLS